MHIERERENMKRRQNAAPAPQPNTTHPSTSFKSVSLQPPSQPSVPARRPTLPNQPVTPNPAPKRDLKLTVSSSRSVCCIVVLKTDICHFVMVYMKVILLVPNMSMFTYSNHLVV